MSDELSEKLDDVILLALREGVSLSDLKMAMHDRYIELEDE